MAATPEGRAPGERASAGRARVASNAGSPRNLLMTKPAISAWSAGSSTATRAEEVREHAAAVDVADHERPGGRRPARAPCWRCRSARRLISAGEPAPSQTTTSNRARSSARLAVTTSSSAALRRWYDSALTVPSTRPRTTTWPERSLPGLSSTGLNATLGARPQAAPACACARPISPPSARDDGVVGHVLRLERRHRDAPPVQPPAEPRHDHALARVGRRAGDQQRTPHTRTLRPGTRIPAPLPTVNGCGSCCGPGGSR